MDDSQDPQRASACRSCGGRLAPDQRYCLRCGTRRGTLPFAVGQMVSAMMERNLDPVPRVEVEPVPEPEPGLHIGPWQLRRLPGPQALAAMLLAAIGFGVLAGSIAPAPVQALVSAPLLLLVDRGSSHPTPVADNSGADQGGGAAQTPTQETITETTPAPATQTPVGSTTPATTTTTPSQNGNGGSGPSNLLGLPPIKHVFLVVLADQGFSQTFDPAGGDRYLSRTLAKQGELIEDYYGVAGSSLANGVALISGQGPTPATLFNCPRYQEINQPEISTESQVVGTGCVYPLVTQTIADQLTAKGLKWRAYIDGIDAAATGRRSACRHPAPGAPDADYAPTPTRPYVTWRNPFVYFQSITSTPECAKDDVGIGALAKDLKTVKTTPALSYIVPSPCEDGDATPCRPGAKAGLKPADAFVRRVVAEIKRSPAYKAGGLIAITFDHAPQGGPDADANACCSTPPYPNLPQPSTTTTGTTTTGTGTTTTTTGTTTTGTTTTGTTTTGTGTTTTGTMTTGTTTTGTATTPATTNGPNPGDIPGQTVATGGGGQVGIVLLTAYVKPGTVESIDYYNHYSLLGTFESLFGLQRLGFAGDAQLPLFDAGIFNAHPKGG